MGISFPFLAKLFERCRNLPLKKPKESQVVVKGLHLSSIPIHDQQKAFPIANRVLRRKILPSMKKVATADCSTS